MAIQRFDIDSESIVAEVGALSMEELDALPFGAIQLDRHGTVLAYNKAEERLAGKRSLS